MGPETAFLHALAARRTDDNTDFFVLPTLLAQTCTDVFPVAGASIGVLSDLRLPLGADSVDAAEAEQHETTLGTGPCLTALTSPQPIRATETAIAAQWPLYHHQLVRHTPFRSVLSLPLIIGSFRGAIDLYDTNPTAAGLPTPDQAWQNLGQPITELMRDVPTGYDRTGAPVPVWLQNPPVKTRLDVWIAVGMILTHHHGKPADALALLRSHAFTTEQTLDQLTSDLINRRTDIATVLEPP